MRWFVFDRLDTESSNTKMENRSYRKQKSKGSDEENDTFLQANNKKYKRRTSYRMLTIYSSILFILFVIIGFQILYTSHKVTFVDRVACTVGYHSNVYAVIIDAGSTGSRVLALSFYKSGYDGALRLEGDYFNQIKPGLSSFAKKPKEGAETISDLLKKAMAFIPEDTWGKTPVALRATAGLRLLGSEEAENLLKEVREVINDSPFYSDEDSVSIMDGKDEGLFSWFTVNFLLDHLHSDPSQSIVMLDLGGGSVQITFLPDNSDRITHEAPHHLYTASILNKKIDIYSYSYLGLGLMAARQNILLKENPTNATAVESSCVDPNIKDAKWSYAGTNYVIKGKSKGFDECYQIIKGSLAKHNVDKPPEISGKEIVAISYFFDRAVDSGLIAADVSDAVVSVNDFKTTAMESCKKVNPKMPLMCLDLSFMAALLEHGFGLKPSTKLRLVNTIDGHEISWALGAGFSILENKYA